MKVAKFYVGLYSGIIAVGVVSVFALSMFSPTDKRDEQLARVQYNLERISSTIGLLATGEGCVPKLDTSVGTVAGLSGQYIPKMPDAARASYGERGSQYFVAKDENEIYNYYNSKLAAGCWKLVAMGPHDGYWTKGDESQTLRIATYRNAYGGKTLVTYDVFSGKVAGYTLAQAECTAAQIYCPGYGCLATGSPCPPSSSTTTSCPTPPTGCTSGYNYDSNNCPISCYTSPTPSTTCSGSYTSTGATYTCNYTTCPSGCTYDSVGCANGCTATTPPPSTTTCSGTYQQPGSTTPTCNYATCPNGCNWSNGCPSGCYTPTACSGTYQQSGSTSPSCNYSVCPSGCTWGADGCPSGCMSSTPSCPSGQYWCSSNNTCISNTASCSPTGTSQCAAGMYWCSSMNSCISNTVYCAPTGTTGGDTKASCESGGGLWCQPTYSPHCHFGPNPSPCEPDTSGYYTPPTSCPTGQYYCNGGCISTNTACTSTGPTSCPSGQYLCNNACIPSGSSCNGYPYYPPGGGTQCGSGMYYCSSSNSCVPNSSPCSPSGTTKESCVSGGGLWCQPSTAPHCHPGPNPATCEPDTPYSSCPSGQYWCSSQSACISNTTSCYAGPQPTPCPAGQNWCSSSNSCVSSTASCPGTTLCPSDKYWCASSSSCIPMNSPCVTSTTCPSGMYWCSASNSCKSNSESCTATQCGSNSYWCPITNSCLSNSQVCSQTQPPVCPLAPYIECPTGQYRESFVNADGCVISGECRTGGGGGLEQIDKERFEQMKRDLNRFTRSIKRMRDEVNRQEKKLARSGVGIPAELKAALKKIDEIVAKIKDAKTAEELQTIMEDLADTTEVMNEWSRQFGELQQLADMLRRVDRDVRNIRSAMSRAQSLGKRNTALKEKVDELVTVGNAMIKAVADVRVLAKTEPDSALDKLNTEFYEKMEEFWNTNNEIEMLGNLTRGLSRAQAEIRRIELRINSLARSKRASEEAIAEMRNTLSELKTAFKELQAKAKQRPQNFEEIMEIGEGVFELFESLQNMIAEVGQGFYAPTVKRGQDIQFELPESYIFERQETVSPPTPLPPSTQAPATTTPAVTTP